MKKTYLLFIFLTAARVLFSQNWSAIKDTTVPIIEIPSEYDTAYRQPLSNLGWEDGIHISPDGLNLYCTYAPIDLLSFVLNGSLPNNFSNSYLRGAPTFGMDLTTNPLGSNEWIHADILYAQRNSILDSFNVWTLSNMARPFFSEGAPTPAFFSSNSSIEFMAFTSIDNPTNNQDIWVINNTTANPSGIGSPLPAPVNSLNTEDNPHLTRLDTNNLVLFFDSNNLPGGLGDIDIWYSSSSDNGASWSIPNNVNVINTSDKEHQPFLHFDNDSSKWFLYYSAPHNDGKLAIYRAKQNITNNWNSWETPELVISAGNSAGIGEPTLTSNGDLSFVLIYQDSDSTSAFNRFDADPWFLRKKNTPTSLLEKKIKHQVSVYPNPSNGLVNINAVGFQPKIIEIYDLMGRMVLTQSLINKATTIVIDLNTLNNGTYFLAIKNGSLTHIQKLIKN